MTGNDRGPRAGTQGPESGRAGSGTTTSVARRTGGITEVLSDAERRALVSFEQVISDGMKVFRKVGTALGVIHDGRLYRETHGTFEDYVSDRWGLSTSHSYRLIDAANVVQNITELSPIGDVVQTESQARELVGLAPETSITVIETAMETNNGRVTAAALRQARADVVEAPGAPPRAPSRRPLPDAFRDNVESLKKDVLRLERHMLEDDRFRGHAELLASRHYGDLDRTCALLDSLCEKLKVIRATQGRAS